MSSYRTYLDSRNFPPAGWVTLANGLPAHSCVSDSRSESQDRNGLGAKHGKAAPVGGNARPLAPLTKDHQS